MQQTHATTYESSKVSAVDREENTLSTAEGAISGKEKMNVTGFLMNCGHVAQGYDSWMYPVCVCCAGNGSDDYKTIAKVVHGTGGIEGRSAKCSECGKVEESRWKLPFFKRRPDDEFDGYYCGCRGWD